MAEWSSALDSSSDVARMWVRIPAWPVAELVSLSKTLNHNCFILRMGRKAVGPVCCVMHVKESRTLVVKKKGLAPVFLNSRLEHPAGWICARYKSSVLLIVLLLTMFSLTTQWNKLKTFTGWLLYLLILMKYRFLDILLKAYSGFNLHMDLLLSQNLLALNPRVLQHASLVTTKTTKQNRKHWKRNGPQSCAVRSTSSHYM